MCRNTFKLDMVTGEIRLDSIFHLIIDSYSSLKELFEPKKELLLENRIDTENTDELIKIVEDFASKQAEVLEYIKKENIVLLNNIEKDQTLY